MKFRRLASKMVLTAAAVLSVLTANAEGYQINSQSARQWGMAHTGTALKLGAESMLFNPAGMAYMNSKFDVSLGTIMIKSKVEFEQPGYTHKTDNPLSTPIFGHIGFKPFKNLAFGVNVTNPAGNSLVWGDNWAGSTLIQDVSLKAFNVQPTVSYKINDRISVGAGLMIDFGSFEQRKGLVAAGAFDALASYVPSFSPMIATFQGKTPVGLAIEGSSKVAYGFNVGALVNLSEKLTLGVSYRSKVKLSVEKGDANIEYTGQAKEFVAQVTQIPDATIKQMVAGMGLPEAQQTVLVNTLIGTKQSLQTLQGTAAALDGSQFSASMPIPSIFSAGLAYKPTDKWTVTGEAQFTQWSAYDNLEIAFKNGPIKYVQKNEKNYKNTVAVRLGAEFVASNFITVRAGAYMDTPPVQMDKYNPETPSADSYGVTAGATLNPIENLAIDLSVGYLRGKKTTGTFDDPIVGAFTADYTKSAIMPGVAVRFNF